MGNFNTHWQYDINCIIAINGCHIAIVNPPAPESAGSEVNLPASLVASPVEEALFQRWFKCKYDLYIDEAYVSWLKFHQEPVVMGGELSYMPNFPSSPLPSLSPSAPVLSMPWSPPQSSS